MKKLTSILLVIILMTSCKSNKTTDTENNPIEKEEVYTFNTTDNFLDSVKNNIDKYKNKRVEIIDGYCDLLEDEKGDTTYMLFVMNKFGKSSLMLCDIGKKSVDTLRFKMSKHFYNSSRVIDTKNGNEIEDVDDYMYDGEDGHVHDIFGDISRVLRYEEYDEEYNKEDIPLLLKKITNTSIYKNFIEDMKVGRYIVITSSKYDSLYDVYNTDNLLLTKVSFTGTYIGYNEVKSDLIGVKDKNGNVDGLVVGSHIFKDVVFTKIDNLDIPKIYTIPNKSIDFSSYLNNGQ